MAFHAASALGREPEMLREIIAGTMQQMIDDLPEQIAMLDEQFNILAVNDAWRNIVKQHGYLEALPGHNYIKFCAKRVTEGYEPAIQAVAAFEEIAKGQRDQWHYLYNGGPHWGGREYQIRAHRISVGRVSLIMVSRFDLTEVSELRRANEDLTTSLEESQITERQRMARELHDSTSQLLVSIGLLLGGLRHKFVGKRTTALIGEIEGLLGEALGEIRTISFLAHPPCLETSNLSDALRSLAQGFARRAKLEISCDIQPISDQIPDEVQTAIYRVAQEALSNIHRHAAAKRIAVRLCMRGSALHLMVADDGIGISKETMDGEGFAGVGLSGMRLRLAEIGGRLAVVRISPGTAVFASVRIAASSAEAVVALPQRVPLSVVA